MPPKTRCKGPPANEMDAMMPAIRDLKEGGLTNREVMEVMIWLYNFKAPYVPFLSNSSQLPASLWTLSL